MHRRHHLVTPPALLALVSALVIFPTSLALAQGTDHFKCYVATELTLDQPIPVSLEDQFAVRPDVQILNAVWFCNPVAKTVDGVTTDILEPENHLTLYPFSIKSPEPRRLVTVRNQFGTQELVLTAPRLLAVPTQKAPLGPTHDISHFECYEARDASLGQAVSLEDQFHTEDGRVLSATYFCNPVTKTRDDVVTPPEPDEEHLTCYKVTPSEQPPADFVDISNQFDTEDTLMINPSQYLCVPSEKLSVTSGGRTPDAPPDAPTTATTLRIQQ
jgi:hypothetical protein